MVALVVVMAFLRFSGHFDERAVEENNEALILLESGDADTAAMQLEEALKKTSDKDLKVTLLKNLAYAYWDQYRDDLALQTFKRARDLTEKGEFDYYFISGEIYLIEGNYEEALASYNKALEINDGDFQIHNALFNFYIEETEYIDYGKALEHAKKANNYSDGVSKQIAFKNLGIAYYFEGNYEESLKIFLTMDLEKEPEWNIWIGWSYVMMNDEESAMRYFQKAKDLGEDIGMEAEEYLMSSEQDSKE